MSSKSMEAIRRTQHELARRGFDPGPIDGIWGRMTESAVKRYQQAHGLLVDGIVGPKTSESLFSEALPVEPAQMPGGSLKRQDRSRDARRNAPASGRGSVGCTAG